MIDLELRLALDRIEKSIRLLDQRCERIAACGLTRFGTTELQHVAAGGLMTEVMVEGEHAVDLGARQIERLGDHRNRGLRDITEGFLQRV